MKTIGILLVMVGLAGCGAAERAQLFAIGSDATVKCYSGETVIYEGKSNGKVESPQSSDGYVFMDASTKKLTEVSGNCVITYGTD